MSHPSEDIKGARSSILKGKRIVLGITGSIAAVECVKLIRELIRHNAEVIPVMSPEATRIIHPNAIHFAAGRPPITELTGDVEHVMYCGDRKDKADLLLIAPATANTISKIAVGIDDTPVTTFATTALGSGIPVMISPAMHGSMIKHTIIQENIEKLRSIGVDLIAPREEENKAKIATTDMIVTSVIRRLHKNDLEELKVLIISGSTVEHIDDMRVITNNGTGMTGYFLAYESYIRGGEVTLMIGSHNKVPQFYWKLEEFSTTDNLSKNLASLDENYDIIIVCAAISDFAPAKAKGKISSKKKEISLDLKPTPKVLELLRKTHKKAFIVGYKAESGVPKKQLIDKAYKRMKELKIDAIVANDLKNVSELSNRVVFIDKKKRTKDYSGRKSELATGVMDSILKARRG
jgi:phosphopantothenoylcysteine decarboxylase/phosphopantothenate--cysteine ligase